LATEDEALTLRTFACPDCPLCGSTGAPRYTGLRDRLFSVPGEWNLNSCPNPSCGVLWLNPMPCEEDLGLAYRDYLTHQQRGPLRLSRAKLGYLRTIYGGSEPRPAAAAIMDALVSLPFRFRFRRRIELDEQVMFLRRPYATARALDIGCGGGDVMAHLSMLGWTVEGVEFDAEAAKTARARGLTVHLGTVAEQRFADGAFDAVVLSHVIEHVPRPIELLRECLRILKPDGALAMATPNAESLAHRLYGAHWFALDPPRHLHLFTLRAMATAVRKAGFVDLNIRSSVRGADHIAFYSDEIRRHGRVSDETHSGWRGRRVARALQAIELAALPFADQIGEEIFVRARKGV
jgi:2-polyprenyl-3-methyl-5-hydroxy-6-metoxy-1,4-benzoquinol methylase